MGTLCTKTNLLFSSALLVSIANTQIRQATISNSNPVDGISILSNPASVTLHPNEWTVTFADQVSYDLLLKLNNQWGFDSISPSTITLTLNGTNYNTVEGDLLLVFSASNSHYFGIVIRNEQSSQLYKAFPRPTISTLFETNISHTISQSTPDRWDRITQSTTWYNTVPIYRNPIGQTNEWPIKLSILNDPTNNITRFAQIDHATNEEMYSAIYQSNFPMNEGMDIYMMSDGETESFGIFDINIEYQIQIVTTTIPTIKPTTNPSTNPSITPTNQPSVSPSISPTSTPSRAPTERPSRSPIQIPTLSPTMQPKTKLPTPLPSQYPTLSPIIIEKDTIEVGTETNDTNDTNDGNVLLNDGISINNGEDVIIAASVTGVIGFILCGCTCLLIVFCVQSQNYERKKLEILNTKHMKISTASNAATHVILTNNDSNLEFDANINNRNSDEHSSDNNNNNNINPKMDIDGDNDTEDSQLDEEEKEGELVTQKVPIMSSMDIEVNMADMNINNINDKSIPVSVQSSASTMIINPYDSNAQSTVDQSSSNRNNYHYYHHHHHHPPVHYNTSTFIVHSSNDGNMDYNKMNSYLNDETYSQNQMSSSSGEHILELGNQTIDVEIEY